MGAWGSSPETFSSPYTPGGAPVCSPQQYKDCANPALGKGQTSPASRPHPARPEPPTPPGRRR